MTSVSSVKTAKTARWREVPHAAILETTGSSKYASTAATAKGMRIGWRKPRTREVSQMSPTAIAPMPTTDSVVSAAQIVFFCQGVGNSGWFIRRQGSSATGAGARPDVAFRRGR